MIGDTVVFLNALSTAYLQIEKSEKLMEINVVRAVRILSLVFCFLYSFSFVALEASRAAADGHSGLVLEAPWVRATVNKMRPTAGYLTIRNTSSTPDTLVSVSAAFAHHVELHEVYKKDGAMGMRETKPIVIAAGSSVTLKPGGLHIMFMKLKKPLKEGTTVELTLSFKQAGHVVITAPVRTFAP